MRQPMTRLPPRGPRSDHPMARAPNDAPPSPEPQKPEAPPPSPPPDKPDQPQPTNGNGGEQHHAGDGGNDTTNGGGNGHAAVGRVMVRQKAKPDQGKRKRAEDYT